MDQFNIWINSVLGFHKLRNFSHWVSKHCCSTFRGETHSLKCSKTIDLSKQFVLMAKIIDQQCHQHKVRFFVSGPMHWSVI